MNFLIVDDEPDLRELLVLILGSKYKSQFLEAGNATEAIKLLETENVKVDFVVSDFNMPKGNGATLAKFIREKLPQTPFLLVTSDDRQDHQEILTQPLTGYFEKPFSEEKLTEEIDRLAALSPDFPNAGIPIYMPISLNSLERLETLGCPVYVKLNDTHFVKVLGEKDTFSEATAKRFHDKGLSYLYLHQDHFSNVLIRFKELVQNDLYLSALKSKKSEALKISKTIQELVNSATRVFGWNDEVMALGNEGIKLIHNMVQFDDKLKDVFDWFDDDSHDIGVLTSMLLTYMLASITTKLSLQNPRALDYLSLAAFFHDMPLSDHLIRNQRKYLKAMQLGIPANKSDLEQIITHAERAKELLLKWEKCPKEVLVIIEQHTERPDGSGFPRALKADEIDELAGTFIVANEIVQLYINHRDRDSLLTEFASMAPLFNQATTTRKAYAVALSQLAR
jgi:response regulator RpfG family c-di-GMP phosphodiesterase